MSFPPFRPSLGLLAIPLLAVACDPATPKVPASFADWVNAPAEPGQGIGSLHLDETTLRDCVTAPGPGKFSVIFGDDYYAELKYLRGQLVL